MGTSTYTERLPSSRSAMTDPRRLRFPFTSNPRIEKHQPQHTYIRRVLRFYIFRYCHVLTVWDAVGSTGMHVRIYAMKKYRSCMMLEEFSPDVGFRRSNSCFSVSYREVTVSLFLTCIIAFLMEKEIFQVKNLLQ